MKELKPNINKILSNKYLRNYIKDTYYNRKIIITDIDPINFSLVSKIFYFLNMINQPDDSIFALAAIPVKHYQYYYIDSVLSCKCESFLPDYIFFRKDTNANIISDWISLWDGCIISNVKFHTIRLDTFLEDLYLKLCINTEVTDNASDSILSIAKLLIGYHAYKLEDKCAKYSIYKLPNKITNRDFDWIIKLDIKPTSDDLGYYLIEYPEVLSDMFTPIALPKDEEIKIINKMLLKREKEIKFLISKCENYISSIKKIIKNLI